ncbi:MAG: FtsX-like permease family protein [Luteitalea sp.]|nr:FtsX-like permease family protein [Luteitalea sp.]
MQGVFDVSLSAWRFRRTLLAAIATLALALAAAGIYGVMTFSVTLRTREIGIRMALGARPLRVLRMVMATGLRLATVGVTIGLAGAWMMSGLFSAFVFGITATDSTSSLWAAGMLLAVALLAVYIPGLRASKLDPIYTLRRE